MTAIDQIALDNTFTQVKNGDGFTPLGPWIETELDPTKVGIEVRVEGSIVARSSTSDLARDVTDQLVYLTTYLTLGPGDVVLTGAPGTSAPIRAGQSAAITLRGIGTLRSPTVAAPPCLTMAPDLTDLPVLDPTTRRTPQPSSWRPR